MIILDHRERAVTQAHGVVAVNATQIKIRIVRIIQVNHVLKQLPALGELFFWPRKLEVVDLDNQQQVQVVIEEATRPLFTKQSEATRTNTLCTMVLPKSTGLRMTIQGKH